MLRKFMTTVALGSLFVGGLATAHLAYAQPGADAGPRGRGGMMAQSDANKDGKISKAEFTTTLEARFAKMDVDHDGQITQKDRDARRQQRLDNRFAQMDTDRNSQISKSEFAAAHQARADKRGANGRGWGKGRRHGPARGMMDAGPNGRGRDGDKDGTLTRTEFMAAPLAMFDRADANKDGFVTTEEMASARQARRGQWRGPAGNGRDVSPPAPSAQN